MARGSQSDYRARLSCLERLINRQRLVAAEGPSLRLIPTSRKILNLLPQAAMSEWKLKFGLSVAAVTVLIVLATLAAAFAP
jgi:hypothetical protein